jgi:predicted ATPase
LTLSRKQQVEAASEIVRLVPAFSDVDFIPSPGEAGQVQMRFHDRWSPSVWYSPSEVSDGTMLVTAYVLVQFQRRQPSVLAIEEPERGVHPYLLGELVSLWRKMTKGEIAGRPVQIVLATHSAELLEYLEPDEVRFLSRDPESGATRIQEAPTGDEHWRDAYATYQESLGGMWLSGGLGGVPGR